LWNGNVWLGVLDTNSFGTDVKEVGKVKSTEGNFGS
ncbi:hypothetical protein T4E_8420, partial [Trichinella pseudospiralis]